MYYKLTSRFCEEFKKIMCKGNCCGKGCTMSMIAKVLVIIGGINWGLIGIGMLMGKDFNIVHMILGSMATIEAIVYVLVGLAAVMKIFGCKCKQCMGSCEVENKSTTGGQM